MTLPYIICGGIYLLLTALILVPVGRGARVGRTAVLLAVASLATASWAAICAWQGTAPLGGFAGQLDLIRDVIWYGFILHLFRAAEPSGTNHRRDRLDSLFLSIGAASVIAVVVVLSLGQASADGAVSLLSPGLALRTILALCQLLLLENLYRNTELDLRWNVSLACIGLGGLAVFNLAVCAEAALLHRASTVLVEAKPIVALVVCPLLAVAAARNRNWSVDIHISRSAALHTATLAVGGIFLLAVAAAGAVARRFGAELGGRWGGVAQVGLLFAGLLTLAVMLMSGSARSLLRLTLIDHFFTNRYDYRREWMRCINTLSDQATFGALHGRVVRTIAQVVDSPAGMLLLREPEELGLHWADSWNMPQLAATLPPDHPLFSAFQDAPNAVQLGPLSAAWTPLDSSLELWLAVPLWQNDHLAGCVLVAKPRAPFRLDREVFELLRIVAREVATYLAEQRATRVLLETRELRDYGERFAFVAHDIKNVSSQLSLLLSNAETHLANPDFQRDMLVTVSASVQKIDALIRRLQAPGQAATPDSSASDRLAQPQTIPLDRLKVLADRVRRLRGTPVALDADEIAGIVAMDPATFDSVITHLLDNAIEAAGADRELRLRVEHDAAKVVVDVIDTGPGMPPEFVRDQLFRPFRTSKEQGSGIGAFQARALLRAAGGDLLVLSTPGSGTRMRVLLPLVAATPHVITA